MKLAIVSPIFNQCGYSRPVENRDRFIESLRSQVGYAHLYFSEAVYPGQSSFGTWSIPADDRNYLWLKECLVNRAICDLLPDYDAICWIDADLLFENSNWYADTCIALENFPVVQMFQYVVYLDRDGNKQSGGYGTAAAFDNATWRAPGGAIACRRELLANGIYDRHPLGGGDQIFMDACLGRSKQFCRDLNPPFREHVLRWAEAFGQQRVGFVPGMVQHLWHGNRKGRMYVERHQLLASHDFDPEVDVRIGDNGLLEWASDKPALHQAVRDYFINRNEDQ